MNAPVFPALAPSPEQQASIRLRVLSLGAGVQSTTLALMAAHGEIGPMPDCAIFADTGWEPRAVYEHLAWLRSPNVLPFPVHIVSAGDLRAALLAGARGARWASIPAFTRTVTPAGAELPVYDEDENGDLVAVGSRIVPTARHDPPGLPALAGSARLPPASQERLHRLPVPFRRSLAADARPRSRGLGRRGIGRRFHSHRVPGDSW